MRWIGILAMSSFLLAPGIGRAQSVDYATATPVGALSESFDEAPQSSGIPLVGLRIVSSADELGTSRINLSDIVIALPSELAFRICVRVTTQDARYLALNPYAISGGQRNVSRARLAPVSYRYQRELGQYAQSEVAIKTYVVSNDSCNPVSVQHLPRIEASNLAEAGDQVLEVRVNSRGRDARAVLSSTQADHSELAMAQPDHYEVACGNTRNRAGLAFDRICRFHFDDYANVSGAIWTLTLALNDGFADSHHDYLIYLP